MQCQEKMDRASAKISRAKSALRLAMKAGTEATKGELLDTIAAVLEGLACAEEDLREGENPDAQPGQLTPATSLGLVPQSRVVPLASASNAP